MIYSWRKLLDEYTASHKTTSKILLTEAYASLQHTMQYYVSNDGQLGAHMPFNFGLIYVTNRTSAQTLKADISRWLDYMPDKHTPNWVVSFMVIIFSININNMQISDNELNIIFVAHKPGQNITFLDPK